MQNNIVALTVELNLLRIEKKELVAEVMDYKKKTELIEQSSRSGILTGVVGSEYIQDRLLELELKLSQSVEREKKLRECVEYYMDKLKRRGTTISAAHGIECLKQITEPKESE